MEHLRIRTAVRGDLSTIVGLLADDALGGAREAAHEPLPDAYTTAFDAIDSDPRNELIVADDAGAVVGVLQLTFIPGLTHMGGERAQIEGVRVASSHRGKGVGRMLLDWSIDRARQRRCRMVQLTTDKRRPDAHRFYESLGFVASHEGMKFSMHDGATRPHE